MITILINLILGALLASVFCVMDVASLWWSVFWGVLVFIAGQAGVGFILQKRVKVAMQQVQKILEDGQKKLQFKVQQWQMRPPGSVKQAQLEMERDQRIFIERALTESQKIEKFKWWVPLMMRQIATLRLQLYWMLKDFKKVDALLPQALIVDPMMAAIKIARMYMKEVDGIEKVFKKHTVRVRYDEGALLYGLYAWILVQRKDIDGAHKVLINACEKNENETLKRNRDFLANNRVEQFSNAGLGERWYALHLEQPKVKTQRQNRFANKHF